MAHRVAMACAQDKQLAEYLDAEEERRKLAADLLDHPSDQDPELDRDPVVVAERLVPRPAQP
jgi:hypothetical protein